MIIRGDCLARLKELPDNSVDSIVTDPPYGWRFMGKAWDGADIVKHSVGRVEERAGWNENGRERKAAHGSIAQSAGEYNTSRDGNKAFGLWTTDWAKEALRVLKPGGHCLVFCGPRTYHRMASGLEDAGFQIRDQLQWLFGSGFPKSHNLKGEWAGFGTALKPANEPICLARKPLSEKTVAANVEKWGTGAINIDASRVGTDDMSAEWDRTWGENSGELGKRYAQDSRVSGKQVPPGRWPANLILGCSCEFPPATNMVRHDEGCPVAMLDEQSGVLKSGAPGIKSGANDGPAYGKESRAPGTQMGGFGDSGGASRFFYCAKASKSERNAGLEGMPEKRSGHQPLRQCVVCMGWNVTANGKRCTCEEPSYQDKAQANFHPTVKPLKLMEYLIRLITQPGGTVLDPFAGSGSTLVAAKRLGFKFIGIELSDEYADIAERRVQSVIL